MKMHRFTMAELIIVVTAIVMFVVGIILAGAVIIGGCWVGSKIHEEGIKPTAERVWEGPKPEEVDNAKRK